MAGGTDYYEFQELKCETVDVLFSQPEYRNNLVRTKTMALCLLVYIDKLQAPIHRLA